MRLITKNLDIIRRFFSITVLMLTMMFAHAQILPINRFNNITLPYGANIVEQIYQDHYGMIWLITRQGVFTFDGYSTNCILKGNFHAVTEAGEDVLCLGCDHGLRWLDIKKTASH